MRGIGFVSLLILPAIVQGDLFKAGICDGWDDAYDYSEGRF